MHRLIQNKVDGKLVELPDPQGGGGASSAEVSVEAQEMKQRGFEEQHEAVMQEYSLLLTGQLEVQRAHYEERFAELDRRHDRKLWEQERAMVLREEEVAAKLSAVERERRAVERQQETSRKVSKELDFNKQLNEQVMRNQAALKEQLEEGGKRESALRATVADLEEQLRDLTFHFEAQMKIEQEVDAAELSGGSVIAPELETPKAKGKRRARAGGSGGRS